jgi:hypothetical protein
LKNEKSPDESSVQRGFFYVFILRGRPMVGQQALDLPIEVRILTPQPFFLPDPELSVPHGSFNSLALQLFKKSSFFPLTNSGHSLYSVQTDYSEKYNYPDF